MEATSEDCCDFCGAAIWGRQHMHVWERDDGDENVLCVECMRKLSEETYQKEERAARGVKDDKETGDLLDRGTAPTTEARTEEQGERKSRHIQVSGVRGSRSKRVLRHPARDRVPVCEADESIGRVPALGRSRGEDYEREFPDTYGTYPEEK